LDEDESCLAKRKASRHIHEHVVAELARALGSAGMRCCILTEYFKEARAPDAIVFDGKRLT